MKKNSNVILWVFSVFNLLSAIVCFSEINAKNAIAAIFFLLAAIIQNPILIQIIEKNILKEKIKLKNGVYIAIGVVLFVIGALSADLSTDDETGTEISTEDNKTTDEETEDKETAETEAEEEKVEDEKSEDDNKEDSDESDKKEDSKSSTEDKISKLLGKKGYKQFSNACSSINMKIGKISGFKQIDDWASGKRYSFTYKDTAFLLYMLDSNYVDGINCGEYHIYEDGYEPLDVNDFIIDIDTLSALEVKSEEYVKEQLNYPDTANFNWWTTGSFTRVQNYWVLSAELTAKNAFNVKETITFRTDYTLDGDTLTLKYFTMNDSVILGEESIPEIERKQTDSKIKGSSEDSIVLTEGQANDYSKVCDSDPTILFYYVPAGTYTAKVLSGYKAFVCSPTDENDVTIYTFSDGNEEQEMVVPDGYYIQLMINTSIELIKK